jgi:hypothetical protein
MDTAMTFWLGCMIVGTLTVICALTIARDMPPAGVRRMEIMATAGCLLLLLGAVMICWRFLTMMAMLPN